ncbi:hypothetical protein J6590_014514 [Homalodisca vitripennis]|nr:hypothetical protein J6590_014514 [Homalodisca vitripennis]
MNLKNRSKIPLTKLDLSSDKASLAPTKRKERCAFVLFDCIVYRQYSVLPLSAITLDRKYLKLGDHSQNGSRSKGFAALFRKFSHSSWINNE